MITSKHISKSNIIEISVVGPATAGDYDCITPALEEALKRHADLSLLVIRPDASSTVARF